MLREILLLCDGQRRGLALIHQHEKFRFAVVLICFEPVANGAIVVVVLCRR
jgi:hypothetical protein